MTRSLTQGSTVLLIGNGIAGGNRTSAGRARLAQARLAQVWLTAAGTAD